MEVAGLDVLSNGQKIHYLLLLLPLITFIFYGFNMVFVSLYVIIIAMMTLYIHILIAFKKQSTDSVIVNSNKKLNEFWYIPYLWVFATLVIISLISFVYSFVLIILNLAKGDEYNYFLFLVYLFVLTFDVFMLFVMRYYRKLVPKLKRKGIIK